MASSTENVKIGACRVYYDGADLGYTKGGVSVEVTTDTYEVKVDQFGETPISENITARKVTVSVPMAETTIDNLVKIMPGATKGVDGIAVVPTAIGTNLLTTAKTLLLRPLANDEATPQIKTEDFVIPKAGTGGALSFSYNSDSERVYNVEFKAYPDEDGNLFFFGGTPA